MGLLECASRTSVWRGYEYYKDGKVQKIEKLEADRFNAVVSGSSDTLYIVKLHTDHPRKSKCTCPHANGRQIICKHIVAAYFTIYPDEAERVYEEAMAYEEEEEERQENMYQKVNQFVHRMKKCELQQALIGVLLTGPEWQFNRFLLEYGLDREDSLKEKTNSYLRMEDKI